jgi:uroporphyrinogen-III synthase
MMPLTLNGALWREPHPPAAAPADAGAFLSAMSPDSQLPQALAGHTVAIPETRESDLFARLLAAQGATVERCPLMSILDAADPQPVLRWLKRLCDGELDDVIFFTGEGARRLLALAETHKLRNKTVEALQRVRKITRGPKPARVLTELGLRPDLAAAAPTTDGVLTTLRTLDLNGRRVGVQLYGEEQNAPLTGYLDKAGAKVFTVAPYRYAPQSHEEQVVALIERLEAGRIGVIAFTSMMQVDRLLAVAMSHGRLDALKRGLARTKVASVGPVVGEALKKNGITVDIQPEKSFFLKPLVQAIAAAVTR